MIFSESPKFRHGGQYVTVSKPRNLRPMPQKKCLILARNKVFHSLFRPLWPSSFSVCSPISPPSPQDQCLGERWAKIHLAQLQSFLKFRLKDGQQQAPSDTTLSRIQEKLSLTDLQTAFAEFINALLPETELIAAVDGKGSSL